MRAILCKSQYISFNSLVNLWRCISDGVQQFVNFGAFFVMVNSPCCEQGKQHFLSAGSDSSPAGLSNKKDFGCNLRIIA